MKSPTPASSIGQLIHDVDARTTEHLLVSLADIVNHVDVRVHKTSASMERAEARLIRLASESSVVDGRDITFVNWLGDGGFATVGLHELTPAARARLKSHALVRGTAEDEPVRVAVKFFKTKVFSAPNALTNERQVAPMPPAERINFLTEAVVLRAMSHQHVVAFLGCYLQPSPDGDGTQIALVQEYCDGGTLGERMERGGYTPAQALQWLIDIADGLAYAHGVGDAHMAHRDLKPENVMMVAGGERAKVIDFSLVRLCAPPPKAQRRRSAAASATPPAFGVHAKPPAHVYHTRVDGKPAATGRTGSLRYMAPEVYRSEEYSRRVDVFAYGVMAWEVLAGRRAYTQMYLSPEQLAEQVAEAQLRPTLPPAWPAVLRELLARCWHEVPASRPEFAEVSEALRALLRDAHANPSTLDGIRVGRGSAGCCMLS